MSLRDVAVGACLLAACLGVLYPLTFQDRPVIEQKNDAIMEADASDYLRLLLDSRWRRYLDSRSEALQRSELRKVVHHVAYFPVAEGVSWTLRLLAAPFGGLSPRGAIFAVNGVLTALSIVLFTGLLRRFGAGGSFAFVVLYACALATWVYAAVPDTWVLSGTLVLLTLVMAAVGSRRPALASIGVALGVGLFMLNAFTLVCLVLVLVPRAARESATLPGLVWRAAGLGLLAVLVWAAALSTLALTQPAFALPRFVSDTLAFRSGFEGGLGVWSPLRWGFTFVHMFVLSVIANQDQLNFSGATLLRTVRHVPFGTLGVLVHLVALAIVSVGLVREAVEAGSVRAFLSRDHVGWALFAGAFYAVGTVGLYADVLVYSPAVLPVLVLLVARYVGTATPPMRVLAWVLAALVVINSVEQVLRFRVLLATL